MGFFDKVKEKLDKFKEDNRNFGTTTKRINGAGFCGTVNRGIKDGDFWLGSYISIEAGGGVIYGTSQDDYTFTADDIAGFELLSSNAKVASGGNTFDAFRYQITFKDGKVAQADLMVKCLDKFKAVFQL